jgi:SAM-dependent methyltransferase
VVPVGAELLTARAKVDAALLAAARRYAATPRRFRYYARAKYRLDPCYSALCARIPAGAEVLDLGCGLGMLAVALAELGEGRQTLGIDWDAAKIAAGQQAAAGLWGVTLQRGDLREQPFAPCDFITLVDVLHYYEPAVQTQVLQRAAAALRPGGQLLIRETDPGRRGGARLTRFIERLMVRLGWNRGPAVHYRPLAALHAELRALGLATEQLELAGATHPGNVLVCASRPPLAPEPL